MRIGIDPGAAEREPQPSRRGSDPSTPHRGARGQAAGTWAVVVACVFAGVGWLYLLRNVGALALGPGVPGALPLQQLAGSDDQPLARLLAAWVPAGVVAGIALSRNGRRALPVRAAAAALVAAVLLVLAGAVSDAAAISDPISTHLTAQLSRAGTWAAVALIALGALLSGWRGRAARPAPSGR